MDHAAALFYMQQFEDEPKAAPVRRVPTTISEGTDESTGDSTPNNLSPRERSPAPVRDTPKSAPKRRGTPASMDRQMTDASVASSGIGGLDSSKNSQSGSHGIGRKPSGARVAPATRKITAGQQRDSDEDTASDSGYPAALSAQQPQPARNMGGDDNSDALAALSFLDQEQSPVKAHPTQGIPPPPPAPEVAVVDTSPPESSEGAAAQYRSSFAPSKQAAERKARLQAQEAASHAAAHKPGRANGKRKSAIAGGWNNSSDEEEDDDEDDEDDDADSDDPVPRAKPVTNPVSPPPTEQPVRPLQPRGRDVSPNPPGSMGDPYAQLRQPQPRGLPPVPGQQRPGPSEFFFLST